MTENTQKNIPLDKVICLVVDDDKFSRTFTKTALYQIGIKNTREAGNSDEAIEMLRNFKIDLILLDQQMPGKSGTELASDIKSGIIESAKNTPIIMVTIDTKEKTVLEAKKLGITEYLVKPISPLALKKRICSALGLNNERV